MYFLRPSLPWQRSDLGNSGQAFKLWYYLDNNFTINNRWPNYQDDVIGAWEDAFLEIASRAYPNISVYRHAAKSDGDVMLDATNNDLPYVVLALMTVVMSVVFYIFMSPGLFHNGPSPRFGERAWRALCAFTLAMLSISSCMGAVGFTGLPFSGVVWYMIFYVLIHICHLMALLVNAVDVVCVALPANRRLAVAAATIGPTMITSSLPIIIAYAVLSLMSTCLPGLRTIAFAGCFGLLMNLFLVYTSFMAVLSRSFRHGGARLTATAMTVPIMPASHPFSREQMHRPCVGVRSIMTFYQVSRHRAKLL